jgi:hypothetical protein
MKITYFLGAGASYNSMPIVGELNIIYFRTSMVIYCIFKLVFQLETLLQKYMGRIYIFTLLTILQEPCINAKVKVIIKCVHRCYQNTIQSHQLKSSKNLILTLITVNRLVIKVNFLPCKHPQLSGLIKFCVRAKERCSF